MQPDCALAEHVDVVDDLLRAIEQALLILSSERKIAFALVRETTIS